jgi:hypothetical protein
MRNFHRTPAAESASDVGMFAKKGDQNADGPQRPDLIGVWTRWEQVAGNGEFLGWILRDEDSDQ